MVCAWGFPRRTFHGTTGAVFFIQKTSQDHKTVILCYCFYMNKNSYLFTYLVIASLLTPASASAYYMSMDIGSAGSVSYSYPSVLGDEDKPEEHKEEKKEEKREEKKEEKKEDKPDKVEERPEKIEIKKVENQTKVKLIKQDKVKQELSPEKVSLKFSAVPKLTLTPSPKKDGDLNADETENEVDSENNDSSDGQEELRKTIKERSERKGEKVEIQSEVHDDGTVELQLESRDVKAKIRDGEIEIDVKNNSIGTTNDSGVDVELTHLPDQALQKFIDRGLSTVPDTMEVGQSGDSFEYTIDATKKEKLFGIFPREAKYKLKMDDQNGVVTEQKVNNNIIDRLLNIFTF